MVTLGAALAMGCLAVATVEPGLAATSDLSPDQAEQERQRLRQRQIEVAAELDAAKASSEELIAALTTLDQAVTAQMAKAAEAQRSYEAADRRHAEIQSQLDANRLEVEQINNDLRVQAIRQYVKPESDDSSVRLLQAGDFDEPQQRKVLSEAVSGNSKDLAEKLRGARGRLDSLREEAAAAKTEAESRRTEQDLLVKQVVAEREAQARLQAEWDRRVANLEAASDDLDAEVAGIDQAVASQRAQPSPGPSSAPAPQSSSGRFIWPVAGRMTSPYGGARRHVGVDIAAPVGTPIWAAQGGRVVQAVSGGGYNGGYGNLVVIDHPGGLQTRYAHLSTVRVSAGQNVSQGHVVGNIGMTGSTTGPHLHFETYLNGTRQNPSNYLP